MQRRARTGRRAGNRCLGPVASVVEDLHRLLVGESRGASTPVPSRFTWLRMSSIVASFSASVASTQSRHAGERRDRAAQLLADRLGLGLAAPPSSPQPASGSRASASERRERPAGAISHPDRGRSLRTAPRSTPRCASPRESSPARAHGGAPRACSLAAPGAPGCVGSSNQCRLPSPAVPLSHSAKHSRSNAHLRRVARRVAGSGRAVLGQEAESDVSGVGLIGGSAVSESRVPS